MYQARVERVAPGFTAPVLHRQVIGPHTMQEEYGLVGGNIFHGELSLGQMFHARPATVVITGASPVAWHRSREVTGAGPRPGPARLGAVRGHLD